MPRLPLSRPASKPRTGGRETAIVSARATVPEGLPEVFPLDAIESPNQRGSVLARRRRDRDHSGRQAGRPAAETARAEATPVPAKDIFSLDADLRHLSRPIPVEEEVVLPRCGRHRGGAAATATAVAAKSVSGTWLHPTAKASAPDLAGSGASRRWPPGPHLARRSPGR